MVGMPYPNIKSLELQEKMSYLDKHLVRVPTVHIKMAGQRSTGDTNSQCSRTDFVFRLTLEGRALVKHL